jgi:hypothetical protein
MCIQSPNHNSKQFGFFILSLSTYLLLHYPWIEDTFDCAAHSNAVVIGHEGVKIFPDCAFRIIHPTPLNIVAHCKGYG